MSADYLQPICQLTVYGKHALKDVGFFVAHKQNGALKEVR